MSRVVQKYLTRMLRENQHRVFSREFTQLRRMYNAKSWTLMGYRLRQIAREFLCGEEKALIEFYHECVMHVKENLDPYILVEILEVIVRSMSASKEPMEVLLNAFDVVMNSADALQLLRIIHGQILLHTHGKMEETKIIVEDLRSEIENDREDMEMRNYCKFHVLSAEYYFITKEWSQSFRSRMKYLNFGLITYPRCFWAEQAYYLTITAMLTEDKYEFSDVRNHPVMEGLRNDNREWLIDVFNAFRTGKSERFKELRYYWMKVPELYANADMLKERVRVLNFFSIASQRCHFPCIIHFAEVAMELRLPVGDVEDIVERAIKTAYIEAKIDSEDKTIEVLWVKAAFAEAAIEFDLFVEEDKVSRTSSSWEFPIYRA